jgi:hypothetical protein
MRATTAAAPFPGASAVKSGGSSCVDALDLDGRCLLTADSMTVIGQVATSCDHGPLSGELRSWAGGSDDREAWAEPMSAISAPRRSSTSTQHPRSSHRKVGRRLARQGYRLCPLCAGATAISGAARSAESGPFALSSRDRLVDSEMLHGRVDDALQMAAMLKIEPSFSRRLRFIDALVNFAALSLLELYLCI